MLMTLRRKVWCLQAGVEGMLAVEAKLSERLTR